MRTRAAALALAIVASTLAVPSATAGHEDGCLAERSGTTAHVGDLAIFPVLSSLSVEGVESEVSAPVPSGVLVYRDTNEVSGIQRSDAFEEDEACGHGPDELVAGLGCIRYVEVDAGTDFSVHVIEDGCARTLPEA